MDTKMTIKEAQNQKALLEAEIYGLIQDFERETNMTVERITLDRYNIRFEDSRQKSALYSVEVEIKL